MSEMRLREGRHYDSTLYGQATAELTPREKEVAVLLCSIPFLSLGQIRRKLGITIWTLKNHRKNIATKLGIPSTDSREMALYLVRNGYADWKVDAEQGAHQVRRG